MKDLYERYSDILHSGGISLIRTDFPDAEGFLSRLTQEDSRRSPELYNGKKPSVYHKLAYRAPYEQFNSLRELIVDIREAAGLHAHFRGLVAVDVTQWLGHEEEEYFTIFLKYLFDHADPCFALVVTNCQDRQYRHMLVSCARYIRPVPVSCSLYDDSEVLAQLLTMFAAERGAAMKPEVARTLAIAVRDNIQQDLRSLTLIERIAEDAAAEAKTRNITKQQIKQYLESDSTIYAWLAVPRRRERSVPYEKEAVLF